MRIKIVHLIDNLKVGGAERQLVLLSTALDSARYEQVVFCMREGGALSEHLHANGIRILILHKRHKLDIRFFLGLVRQLHHEKPDILFCWLFSANLWGRLASFFTPATKIIATERVEGKWKRFYHRWIDKLLYYMKTDILLANSQGVIDYCVKHDGLSPKKIRLVFNAIASLRRQKRELPKRNYQKVVSISRLTSQKGVETFIEAAALVSANWPQARFYIFGEGELARFYMERVEQKNLTGCISFPGKARIETIMGDADLFVSSSVYEGLPNAVMEAMSFGLPIVATDIGGTNELIENGVSGLLVPARDAVSLAVAIEKMLGDKSLGEKTGMRAWEIVYAKFDIRQIVKDMEAVFDEVVGRKEVAIPDLPGRNESAVMFEDPVLKANLDIHRKESAVFDLIHPELFAGIEKELNERDINEIRDFLTEESPLAIEIGAGTGRLTVEYLKRDFQVRAVDLSRDMLAFLKEKTRQFYKLEVFCMEAGAYLSEQTYPVSLVSFSAVLHHLKDYQDILKKAVTLLRLGGILFISHEPVLRSRQKRRGLSFWLDKIDSVTFRSWLLLAKGKQLPVTRYEGSDPYGISGLDEKAILELLTGCGMEIIRFEVYSPRKTRLVTYLDKKWFRTGHQFRIVARKQKVCQERVI